jgi:predicted phage replisome organizer
MAKVDWIKVNINIFSNRKIKTLLKEREGDTYFRIWIQILTIAGECNRNGGLYISDNQPFTIKDFTNITGKSSKTFTKILQKFINLGMLIYKNDTYFVKNWSKYQSADKLKKIAESNKVIEKKKDEKSFYDTQEEIRKEKDRAENRVDESNFETLD